MLSVTNLLYEQIQLVSAHLSTWSLAVYRPAESPLNRDLLEAVSSLSAWLKGEGLLRKESMEKVMIFKDEILIVADRTQAPFLPLKSGQSCPLRWDRHVSIWGPLASSSNVYLEQRKANSDQEDNCTCFLSANRAAEHPDVCSCGWV